MTTTTFDTLAYFEKLKAAGVPEQQAKAQVEVQMDSLNELIKEKLVTKADIEKLVTKDELKELRVEMRWLFGITIAFITIAIKFFH